MAKKNTKIQQQLQEGLKNAGQVVDQQIEGKAAPAPKTPKTPAAAAPSAPAAGATPVAPAAPQAPSPRLQFESEIAKVIKDSEYFVSEFRKIRDGVIRGDSPVGLQDRLQKLATAISNSSKGKLPADQVTAFLTEKVQAQASPAVRQSVAAKEEAAPAEAVQEDPAQRAPSPETGPGAVETLPEPVSAPNVAPTGLSVDPAAPVETPETQVTATTPDQSGLSPEELAMLEAADAQVAGQREQVDPQKAPAFKISDYFTPEEIAQMKEQGLDPYQEALDIRAFATKRGSGISVAPSDETTERLQREQLQKNVDGRAQPEWVLRKNIAALRERRREVMEFASLNPVDDLYLLFDRMFGPTGVRSFEARNSMLDPESYKRGSTAMRMSLFHFALGYLPDDVAKTPQIRKLREQFDAIMRELGVDQDIIDEARSPMATKNRKDFNTNARRQRAAVDEIIRIVDKLKDGGALRRPDVAPALHVLTQLVSDMDSDFATDAYIKFNPENEYGKKIELQVDNLELTTKQLVDRIKARTGEDLRVILTETGEIPRPGWSPLRANGVTFTTSNAVRYETGSRRRYALDKAGIIDERWQQVDAQGLDVPSFINPMHPDPDTTKAAIGFILTTDATADLHYAAGGRGRRNTMRESAIIKQIKDYLSDSGYNDTSGTWDPDLTLDGDIGVGDNIEYTLDSSVVDSEVARRRSLLPPDRLVIVALDAELFPRGTVFQDGKGNSHPILNDYGIMVLPEGHPLVDQAIRNEGKVTKPFALGSVADISAIVGEGEFGQLLVDVDPHVFPAVKHTLPLRDPMGRKGTVALVPQVFLEDAPEGTRIQLRDHNGIPSPRRIIAQTYEDGTLMTASAPQSSKSFSGRGPQADIGGLPEAFFRDDPELQQRRSVMLGLKEAIISGRLVGPELEEAKQGYERLKKYFKDLAEIIGPQQAGIEDVQPATPADGVWERKPVVLAKSVDISGSSTDWPPGIAVGIVANDNGDFPNLGTLADRYLADQDEFDVRRRWVLGDMLGAEQGDDRPRGIMQEDPFYGRNHGAVTDAELERGLAIMREQDELIEAGTPKRDMPTLSPEDEELLGKVRGRLTTNRKFSPARSPYDADEIFAYSEDQWAVAQRTKVDRKTTVIDDADPFVAEVESGRGMRIGPDAPLTAELAADVRTLKRNLVYLLAVRATKANFDKMNNKKGTRAVGDVVGFAPEIAAIRQELSRIGVTTAAIDTFIANVGDRMPDLAPDQRALLESELAKPMRVTLETVTPVSSLPGLSVSSRAYGATGREFLTTEQAGIDPLDRLDKIAYTIASEMAARDQASRTQGQGYLSLDAMLREQAAKEVTADEFAGFGDEPAVESTDELAALMEETPAETRTKRAAPLFRLKGFAGIRTTEELRAVTRKAYTIYSLFQARDDAGDGWVKFINNVLYAENMASVIGDEWRASGEAAIFVERALFSTKQGEIQQLTTTDGKEVGFLSKNFLRDLERNTAYGAELIKFAKENNLEFVLIKKPSRDADGNIIPGQFDDEVFITKAETDKSGKKFLNFADLSDMSAKYGYQALADDTSFSKTEERIRTVLKENGADSLFDVVPTTDNSGRYVLRVRPEALIEFGLFGGDPGKAKEWVDKAEVSTRLSDKRIRQYKIMLDAMAKFKFYQEMNGLAVRLGIEEPFAGVTLETVFKEVSVLHDDRNGIDINGDTSGPFGIRRAIRLKNPNIPGEGVVPRVISSEPIPEAQQTEDWIRYLTTGDIDYMPGVDPMLDAALDSNRIRDELARKIITEGRGGSPESATDRRVETDTTRAMFRRARSSMRAGKLGSILRSNAGQGAAGGALSLALLAGANQLNEDNAKTALAFEALGAVSPSIAAAAALGFTGMNKGDMLRTLINIIGGFGGAAVGSIAGTAALPVAGSFAGGMAGSLAGSTLADNIYSQIVGNDGGQQYVPNNMATASQQAAPPEKDPFSVYKVLGG